MSIFTDIRDVVTRQGFFPLSHKFNAARMKKQDWVTLESLSYKYIQAVRLAHLRRQNKDEFLATQFNAVENCIHKVKRH